eukprot:6195681-Pleurochrysis_carterae.AAC.4
MRASEQGGHALRRCMGPEKSGSARLVRVPSPLGRNSGKGPEKSWEEASGALRASGKRGG